MKLIRPGDEIEEFENLAAQAIYIRDLRLFRRQLQRLMSGTLDLEEQRILLAEMFGEGPAERVIKDYAERIGNAVQTGRRRNLPSGRVAPSSLSAAAVASPAVARPHTFYGGVWRVDENN